MFDVGKKLSHALSRASCADYCGTEGLCVPVMRRVPMMAGTVPILIREVGCERR